MTIEEVQIMSDQIKCIRAEVLAPIKTLVDKQADDEGLWYRAQTSAEGYVQQELRKLHVVIERQLDLTKPESDLAPSTEEETND